MIQRNKVLGKNKSKLKIMAEKGSSSVNKDESKH